MGRYESLGSWKSFLWYDLSYLGPVSCVFTSGVPSGLTTGSGCSLRAARWQVFFPSWVPSGLTIPGGCLCWWQWPPLLTDVKELDFSLSTNDVSNFKDLYHPGSISWPVLRWHPIFAMDPATVRHNRFESNSAILSMRPLASKLSFLSLSEFNKAAGNEMGIEQLLSTSRI